MYLLRPRIPHTIAGQTIPGLIARPGMAPRGAAGLERRSRCRGELRHVCDPLPISALATTDAHARSGLERSPDDCLPLPSLPATGPDRPRAGRLATAPALRQARTSVRHRPARAMWPSAELASRENPGRRLRYLIFSGISDPNWRRCLPLVSPSLAKFLGLAIPLTCRRLGRARVLGLASAFARCAPPIRAFRFLYWRHALGFLHSCRVLRRPPGQVTTSRANKARHSKSPGSRGSPAGRSPTYGQPPFTRDIHSQLRVAYSRLVLLPRDRTANPLVPAMVLGTIPWKFVQTHKPCRRYLRE